MSAPRLNHRVVLEAPERVSDGAGGYVESWQVLGTLWAAVAPRSGRVANGPAGAVSVTGMKLTIRAAPVGQSNRPCPGQRFRMGARLFRIEAVSEVEPGSAYLHCHCEEEIAP